MSFLGVQPRRGVAIAASGSTASRSKCRSFSRIVPRAISRLACGPKMCRSPIALGCCGVEVIGAEYLGTTQIVTVITANGQVKARLPSGNAVRVGQNVGLALRSDKLSLFDAVERTGTALGALCGRPPWLRSHCVDVSKSFGAVEAVRRPFALDRAWRIRRPAWPDRCRKDNDLRLIAGLERPDRGSVVIQGRVVTQGSAGRTRRRVRISAILALSASVGLRQSGLSACALRRGAWMRKRSAAGSSK